jgi:hypothetical protein
MRTKLSKKLILNKETISDLNLESMNSIRAGEASGPATCPDTSPTPASIGCTLLYVDTLCV